MSKRKTLHLWHKLTLGKLSQKARKDYQEYISTNNFFGSKIMPKINDMYGSAPSADQQEKISCQIDRRGCLDVPGNDMQPESPGRETC